MTRSPCSARKSRLEAVVVEEEEAKGGLWIWTLYWRGVLAAKVGEVSEYVRAESNGLVVAGGRVGDGNDLYARAEMGLG
jgi:hypothetical protein